MATFLAWSSGPPAPAAPPPWPRPRRRAARRSTDRGAIRGDRRVLQRGGAPPSSTIGAMSDERRGVSRLAATADRRRIAVIGLRGVIGGAVRTDDTLRTLGEARRNQRVRSVLLEIDSPGGSATESEALYLGVRRLAREKPVVAWIRRTGASGAY